jgi:hypothetical protein
VFPELPTDLSTVEDVAELERLRDEHMAAIKHVAANRRDPEVVGELTEEQVTKALEAAVVEKLSLDAELKARADGAAEYDATIDELAAKAGIELSAKDDDDGEPKDDEDDDEDAEKPADEAAADDKEDLAVEEKPEPVTASATSKRRAPLPAARRHKPKPAEFDQRGLRITSHAAGFGAPYEGGTPLTRKMLGETLTEMVKKRVKPGQRVVVASATYEYPEERILDQRAGDLNTEKIQAVVGPQALVASGGLCAPLTPIYDLPGVETAARPVRDSLPSFQATRGGVIVGATPGMGVYDDAVGVVLAADNETGGTFALKNCRRIDCPEFASVEVDSIYACIEADNLAARAYPELMSRIDELVRAEQARLADSKLLTEMAALSTVVSGGSLAAGAVWSLLGDTYRAAAGYRSRNRMPEAAPLQVWYPAWLLDLLALDVARGQFDRFQTRQQVESILRAGAIVPTFHLDGSSTAADGQIFGAQTDGALLDFPSSVEWILAAPGTFLHLDSGSLDLGIVRDSTLNSTNDFQNFAETWEQVTKVGVESLVVTTELCPSGEVSAPADVAGILCGT